MWGRNVYDNIRRFLQFQLTVNVVALVTAFIGSVILWDSPLAAIQLLWVNLIMDSLASLALATELPKANLLQRPPYRKREYIISQKMMKHILGQSFFQSIILFVFVFGGQNFIPEGIEGINNTNPALGLYDKLIESHPNTQDKLNEWEGVYVQNGMLKDFNGAAVYSYYEIHTPSRHLTVVFNLFVLFQIWNMLAARKINDEFNFLSGVFTNLMFITVWLIIVVGQILITQFGGKAMKVHIRGLTMEQWIICIVVSAVGLIWNAILKAVPDKFFPQMGDETEEEVRIAKLDYETLRGIASVNKQIN
jgi:Ca2+ transporting ATPase